MIWLLIAKMLLYKSLLLLLFSQALSFRRTTNAIVASILLQSVRRKTDPSHLVGPMAEPRRAAPIPRLVDAKIHISKKSSSLV